MASVPSIELKRHYRELPAEHVTEVAETVADLIVNFIKSRTELSEPHGPDADAATPAAMHRRWAHGQNGKGT